MKPQFSDRSSARSPDEEVVSLVHQPDAIQTDDLVPIDESEGITAYLEPSGLDSFFTLWGMGAIALLLVANSLLSWGQWRNTPSVETARSHSSNPRQLSLANRLNLASGNTDLSLNSLSTLTLPKQPTLKNRVPSVDVPIVGKTTPVKPVMASKTSRNLTEALLPPSGQPQLMPTYPVAPEASRTEVPYPDRSIALPPSLESIAPSVKPTSEPSPVTASGNNPSPISKNLQAIANEQLLEQLRQRENAPSSLSFEQKYKAKVQAAQNRGDANELMQQIQQQQQQQQQQPAPSSIIIDRSGTSINY